jgi:hypothetical protein
MTTPKFPHVNVKLIGQDGNAFAIMGRTARAMRDGGCSDVDVAAYLEAATSGNYDNMIAVTFATVVCDEPAWD